MHLSARAQVALPTRIVPEHTATTPGCTPTALCVLSSQKPAPDYSGVRSQLLPVPLT